jgi:scyllo-inositol 2-dehydrogenase (NADP+)
MKFLLIFGYGIQGQKRAKVLKKKKVKFLIIDPLNAKSNYKTFEHIPDNLIKKVTHAIISTPYNNRLRIMKYLLNYNIKILIEKPAISNLNEIIFFKKNIKTLKSKIYVAYNHKFEQCIQDLKKLIKKRKIGKIYTVFMSYGNGTAKDIKKSKWKDKNTLGAGLDLLPHLLDIYYFLFNRLPDLKNRKKSTYKFENNSTDFINLNFNEFDKKFINFKASYIYWKNFFEVEIIGSKGFIKLTGLPKWKFCKLLLGYRKLPSGLPKIKSKMYGTYDQTFNNEINQFINNKFQSIHIKREINIYRLIAS